MSDTTTAGVRLGTLTDEFLESRFDANPGAARHFGLNAWDGRLPCGRRKRACLAAAVALMS